MTMNFRLAAGWKEKASRSEQEAKTFNEGTFDHHNSMFNFHTNMSKHHMAMQKHLTESNPAGGVSMHYNAAKLHNQKAEQHYNKAEKAKAELDAKTSMGRTSGLGGPGY